MDYDDGTTRTITRTITVLLLLLLLLILLLLIRLLSLLKLAAVVDVTAATTETTSTIAAAVVVDVVRCCCWCCNEMIMKANSNSSYCIYDLTFTTPGRPPWKAFNRNPFGTGIPWTYKLTYPLLRNHSYRSFVVVVVVLSLLLFSNSPD